MALHTNSSSIVLSAKRVGFWGCVTRKVTCRDQPVVVVPVSLPSCERAMPGGRPNWELGLME